MVWTIDESLAQAEPPFLLISASSANVNDWNEEVISIPTTGNQAFTRRLLLYASLRAVNNASTVQLDPVARICTYMYLQRGGQIVSPYIKAEIHHMGATGNSNVEQLPMAVWERPLPYPVRGGDDLIFHTPGDASGTPTQDWQLNLMFGVEIYR